MSPRERVVLEAMLAVLGETAKRLSGARADADARCDELEAQHGAGYFEMTGRWASRHGMLEARCEISATTIQIAIDHARAQLLNPKKRR